MNGLRIFENSEFGRMRVVEIDNEPWFVGKDVAGALDYNEPHKAVAKHVFEEDRTKHPILTDGGMQEMWIINESGLYSLILGSKLESAKKFKHWVTAEILPSIRKHGMYAKEELLDNPDLLISVVQELKSEREKNKVLQADIKRMKEKEIFADAVTASHTSILVGDLARMIMQNGVEIGQKRLFTWLREKGYLIKRKGSDWNMPTQKSMELGLFEVKESTIYNPDGSVRINRTTKVTGKGQQYFINKFKKKENQHTG